MDLTQEKEELIKSLNNHIDDELNQLEIPQKYIELEQKILAGGKVSDDDIKVSANEEDSYLALSWNVRYREKELDRAMGLLLLCSSVANIRLYSPAPSIEDDIFEYVEYFWTAYGDYQIRACSLLDSVGVYLTFAFFGLMDAPLYYNQVIESIELKHVNRGKRTVLEGDPFTLIGKDGWEVLVKARKRYSKVRAWRDEIIHPFSPLMYMCYGDKLLDKLKMGIVRSPWLEAAKALEECKETYYLLRIVPEAAKSVAAAYIDTGSYHRNYENWP